VPRFLIDPLTGRISRAFDTGRLIAGTCPTCCWPTDQPPDDPEPPYTTGECRDCDNSIVLYPCTTKTRSLVDVQLRGATEASFHRDCRAGGLGTVKFNAGDLNGLYRRVICSTDCNACACKNWETVYEPTRVVLQVFASADCTGAPEPNPDSDIRVNVDIDFDTPNPGDMRIRVSFSCAGFLGWRGEKIIPGGTDCRGPHEIPYDTSALGNSEWDGGSARVIICSPPGCP
jgi:hypothetical protein